MFPSDSLAIVGLPFAFVSLLSSVLFLIAFALDSKHSSKLSIKLLFCIQTCDSMQALGFILILSHIEEVGWCDTQAFFLQLGSLCSILCRLMTTLVLYCALNKDEHFFDFYEGKVLIGVISISLLLTSIPFITKEVGPYEEWCWIRQTKELDAKIISIFTFYFELWLAVLIIILLVISINRYLLKFDVNPKIRKLRKKVKYYPLVLIICWFFPSVDRIMGICGSQRYDAITVIHLMTMNSPGLLNFGIFGWPYTKKIMKERINKLRKKGQKPNKNNKNDSRVSLTQSEYTVTVHN